LQTGTVSLNNGQGSGQFLPEVGATLIFSATYEVDSNLTGAGTNLLNNGTFTLNGNINGSNVVLNGASLLASNTAINGALTWNSGAINAGSLVTVATNRLLVLASGNGHYLYGTMTNAGTIQLLNGGGDLYLYGNCNPGAIGELVNLPGALVDVQGDNSIAWQCSTELVVNQGVLRKSGGTNTTTIVPTFNNSGTVQANSGTVSFGNVFIQNAGQTVLNGGNFAFSQVAQLLGGNLTGAGTITGSVSNNAAIGTGAAGIGVGTLFGQFLNGALRNPSAVEGQFGRLIFGFAVTEALGIFALLIAFLLLFAV
jgi:F-type H+-transporting ATPase subunit c